MVEAFLLLLSSSSPFSVPSPGSTPLTQNRGWQTAQWLNPTALEPNLPVPSFFFNL